jgi:DNA-directed RNA polymerase sigma subunit (sigma70/sigma32)
VHVTSDVANLLRWSGDLGLNSPPIDLFCHIETVESLSSVLQSLTAKEQIVLYKRFNELKTLQEIADELDCCRERIRQLECTALRKLRHPSHLKAVLDVEFLKDAIR